MACQVEQRLDIKPDDNYQHVFSGLAAKPERLDRP